MKRGNAHACKERKTRGGPGEGSLVLKLDEVVATIHYEGRRKVEENFPGKKKKA